MNIKHLEEIAEHYKKEYNLNTFIDICSEGLITYYKSKANYIYLSLEYIEFLYNTGDLSRRANVGSLEGAFIFGILHELKHAIDYKSNPDRYEQELQNLNLSQYNTDRPYHHSRPAEVRADEFARQELEKWI